MATEQTFHTQEGKITVEKYKQQFGEEGSKRTVLIFPGNTSHNDPSKHTLFSVKEGEGLAKLAKDLGNAGVPVLSLPTKGMAQLDDSDEIPQMAKDAVADLWKAVGYGFNLILPVRKKAGRKDNDGNTIPADRYFGNEGLDDANVYEPSFWGLNETTPNIKLAKFYIDSLKELMAFIASKDPNKKPPDKYAKAYNDGLNAKTTKGEALNAWFKPAPIKTATASDGKKHGDFTKAEQESIKKTLDDTIKANYNSKYKVEISGSSYSITQTEGDKKKIITATPNAIVAAENTNTEETYRLMLEAAKVQFKGKKIYFYVPEAEKEKAEKAVKAAGMEGKLQLLTDHEEFKQYESGTKKDPDDVPEDSTDKYKNNLIVQLLNGEYKKIGNDNEDVKYENISYKIKNKIDEGVTIDIHVATQDKFPGADIKQKSEAQDKKYKEVYDKLVAALKEFGITDDEIKTTDHRNLTIQPEGLKKIIDKAEPGSLFSAVQVLKTLETLQIATSYPKNDALIGILKKENDFFDVVENGDKIEFYIKHKNENLAQALREEFTKGLRLAAGLDIADENITNNTGRKVNGVLQHNVTIPKANYEALLAKVSPSAKP